MVCTVFHIPSILIFEVCTVFQKPPILSFWDGVTVVVYPLVDEVKVPVDEDVSVPVESLVNVPVESLVPVPLGPATVANADAPQPLQLPE